MIHFAFTPPEPPVVPTTDGKAFPVRRIFCIGKNYADHVREMGGNPDDEEPVFFTKPADAVITPTADDPALPFPPSTDDLHYEGELVIALKDGGRDIPVTGATACIYGLAVGCDVTRRDLQHAAKKKGLPWDMAKGFDASAAIAPIVPGVAVDPGAELTTTVNGETRQRTSLSSMIWSPGDIIARLSTLVELRPGDLVYTGTPEGVGALVPGDEVAITIGDLPPLNFEISAANPKS